jgi:adenine-specific DNA-methyltransferase
MIDNGKILLGDCLKLLKNISDESIDLTITSPPYNIGKEYEDILPIDEYIDWCIKWIKEIYRITKSNGTFWLNLGYLKIENIGTSIPIPYLLWNKIPFYLNQEIIWNYEAGVSCKNRFSPRNEKWLFYVKDNKNYTFNLDDIRIPTKYPNQKKNGKLKCNILGKNPGDVWHIAKITSGKNRSSKERTEHPAQFPEEIIERIIKVSSNINDIILDPFIGSGTTAVVANRLNRKFIGFEKNEYYYNIIKNRSKIT